MTEPEALHRSGSYRKLGIPAIARMTPHPDGWPQTTGEWEVALRDETTRRYYHEYDSRVIHHARRLREENEQ